MPESRKRPRAIAPARLKFALSDTTGRPLFVQVREQIHKLITDGELTPGMRLPPVRAMASQLKVNQITVARAYRGLVEAGLLEGRRGGGTFVRGMETIGAKNFVPIDTAGPGPLLAERLFDLARAPGVISFSSNYPVVSAECVAEFRQCLLEATDQQLASCLHYEPPAGRPVLRRQIASYLGGQGVKADDADILITSGAQQGIDLAVRALTVPGMSVVIERPTYYGAINTLRDRNVRILEAPIQNDGIDLDVVERHLKREQARLIFTNPTFQNPTGTTMSLEKRQTLLSLARSYGAAILEDDQSPELRFDGKHIPSIRALAEQDDLVFYVRGFGKVFLPGTRLGFLVLPSKLRRRLLAAKAHADLHCNSLMQEALAKYLARAAHAVILEDTRRTYAARQSLMHEKLKTGMPAGTSISNPQGGLSFWLSLPEGTDISELYFRAVRRGVSFVAGDIFYASAPKSRSLRVSFGLTKEDQLVEGVERLCSVVKDLLTPQGVRNLVLM